MSHELREGVRLRGIRFLPSGIEGEEPSIQVGSNTGVVKEIVVSEQIGQMGMVPWARVIREGYPDMLVNLANVESVEFAEDQPCL